MARTRHDGKIVDPDNDSLYVRPKAWKDIKRASHRATGGLDRLLVQLERDGDGCPRELLKMAIAYFLSASRDERGEIIRRYDQWLVSEKIEQQMHEEAQRLEDAGWPMPDTLAEGGE